MSVSSSRKPITSASTAMPCGRSISTSAPTGAGKSATAAVRPTVRTTLPSSAVGESVAICSSSVGTSGQLRFDPGELSLELLIDDSVPRFHAAPSARDVLVGQDLRAGHGGKLADESLHLVSQRPMILRMQEHADLRSAGCELQRFFNKAQRDL